MMSMQMDPLLNLKRFLVIEQDGDQQVVLTDKEAESLGVQVVARGIPRDSQRRRDERASHRGEFGVRRVLFPGSLHVPVHDLVHLSSDTV